MASTAKLRTLLGIGLAIGGIALLIANTDGGQGTKGASGSDAKARLADRTQAQSDAANRARTEAESSNSVQAGWTAAATDRLASSYRADQILVAVAEGAALAEVAQRHGLAVARSPGRSGFGALTLPGGDDLSQRMRSLERDPDIVGVMPNGIVRGAADAESMLENAEQSREKAELLEAKALEAEHAFEELLAQGATGEELETARRLAEDLRRDADKAWAKAESSMDKYEARLSLEHRAKIREAQLHLRCSNHPKYRLAFNKWDKIEEPDYSGFTVAVLDTGVAYADLVVDGTTHVAAPSLRTSPIVAPIDLVNNDAHAGDDHQHGTHIASIIGSSGELVGLAPGVGIMPVKVLDARNQGTELDLVEGIHHAVEHGADVINLSLSFGEGYVPSSLLGAAIERAHAAGVVMVAASGNTAGAPVSWPAASPRVVAVASSTIDRERKPLMTSYASYAEEVDLTAMGGMVGIDLDEDGFDDGILAETVMPGDPSQTGYWFYAGTSQAAAVVSGSIVRLMALGASAETAVRLLQLESYDGLQGNAYEDGWGAGLLDIERAERAVDSNAAADTSARGHHVSIHPFIQEESGGKEMEAHAIIHVVDSEGEPVQDLLVAGDVKGSQDEHFVCKTDREGACEIKLDKVQTVDANGSPTDPGMAWVWTVRAMYDRDRVSYRFGGLLYATEGLEAVTAAKRKYLDSSNAALAIYWPPETDDDELGDLVESYIILGAEAASGAAPTAIALTPAVLDGVARIDRSSLELEGSGVSTSPFGIVDFRLVQFGGSGVSTSPFGFSLPPLFAINGTGISTSPFGLHPLGLTQPLEGSGISTSPFGFESNPVLLGSAKILGASAEGSHIALQLEEGGWTAESGHSVASVLVASGLLEGEASQMSTRDTTGSGVGIGPQARPTELANAPLPPLTEE